MAINIQIAKQFDAPGLEALLRAATTAALTQQGVAASTELSVVLSDDGELQRLNREHRGLDEATDVLSFSSQDKDPDSGQPYLGDVVVSVQRAQAQSERGGHSLEAELQLLTIHGVLHLLGHDHGEADEKSRMWGAQAEILKSLGLEISMREEEDN